MRNRIIAYHEDSSRIMATDKSVAVSKIVNLRVIGLLKDIVNQARVVISNIVR